MTVSAAMFLLFVAVPGYLSAWSAGRKEEALRGFPEVLYRGAMNFGACLLLLLSHPRLSENYGGPFFGALAGNAGEISFPRLGVWVLAFWAPALLSGILQQVSDLRLSSDIKKSVEFWNFVAGAQPLEISSGQDALRKVFLCYRVARKRPVVSVVLRENGQAIRGEVLKASWGSRPGLLLGDIEKPGELVWLSMEKISAVAFLNPGVDRGAPASGAVKLLNLIHPGYGDEIRERLEN